jgi:hypothetical protein
MKTLVSWDVMPCNWASHYKYLGETPSPGQRIRAAGHLKELVALCQTTRCHILEEMITVYF